MKQVVGGSSTAAAQSSTMLMDTASSTVRASLVAHDDVVQRRPRGGARVGPAVGCSDPQKRKVAQRTGCSLREEPVRSCMDGRNVFRLFQPALDEDLR